MSTCIPRPPACKTHAMMALFIYRAACSLFEFMNSGDPGDVGRRPALHFGLDLTGSSCRY